MSRANEPFGAGWAVPGLILTVCFGVSGVAVAAPKAGAAAARPTHHQCGIAAKRREARQEPSVAARASFDTAHDLFKQGLHPESLRAFQRLAARDPDDALIHAWLGYLYHSLRQQAPAIAAFRRSIALRPKADTYNNLGNALLANGAIDEAIAAYRKAIELTGDQQQSEPLYNLGTALAKRGDLAGALKAFQDAEKLAPKDALIQNNLGYVYERMHAADPAAALLQRAIDHYFRATELDPTNTVFWRNLGRAYRARPLENFRMPVLPGTPEFNGLKPL